MSQHSGIGASIKRREDFRFLKGIGRYTDDMNLPEPDLLLHCCVRRRARQDQRHRHDRAPRRRRASSRC